MEGQARAPILTPLPPVGSIQRYPIANQPQASNTGPPYNRYVQTILSIRHPPQNVSLHGASIHLPSQYVKPPSPYN